MKPNDRPRVDKHAYCIIAHNDPFCLKILISLIDDVRNDIILIRDKKADSKLFSDIRTKHSKIIMPDDKDLIDINWGGISLVKAELLAFKTALAYDNYSYLHLLSGADLPLKSQDYIHRFFENLPKGTNLVAISETGFDLQDCKFRTNRIHLFTNHIKDSNFFIRKSTQLIRKIFLLIQKAIGYQRKWDNFITRKGHQWVSITQDFANFLIDNELKIIKRFKYVPCADEIYKQTYILSSNFRSTLYDDKNNDAKRKIDWNRGKPYIWLSKDYHELVSSEDLFARKFSSYKDIDIIMRVYRHCSGIVAPNDFSSR